LIHFLLLDCVVGPHASVAVFAVAIIAVLVAGISGAGTFVAVVAIDTRIAFAIEVVFGVILVTLPMVVLLLRVIGHTTAGAAVICCRHGIVCCRVSRVIVRRGNRHVLYCRRRTVCCDVHYHIERLNLKCLLDLPFLPLLPLQHTAAVPKVIVAARHASDGRDGSAQRWSCRSGGNGGRRRTRRKEKLECENTLEDATEVRRPARVR